MTTPPPTETGAVFDPLHQVLGSAEGVVQQMLAVRDATIAQLRAQLEQLQPPVGPVFGINGRRTGQHGITRSPDVRRYYQPGQFPAAPTAAWLADVEQEVTVSWKLPPAEVIAGKHDLRIVSWHRYAAGRLPQLIPGRRHRTVPWHEPASEIRSNQFTGAQHRDHVLHVARLLESEGLTDTFVVCPNYTMGPPSSGAQFDATWVPDVDQAPAGSLIVSGDLYDNPSGGKALAAPYSDPHADLDVLADAATDHGHTRVAVLEVGAPRRTFDPTGVQRIAYLAAFMAATADYPLDFDVVDVWEGVGKWDQRFTLPHEWAWLADLLASSPQTRRTAA